MATAPALVGSFAASVSHVQICAIQIRKRKEKKEVLSVGATSSGEAQFADPPTSQSTDMRRNDDCLELLHIAALVDHTDKTQHRTCIRARMM